MKIDLWYGDSLQDVDKISVSFSDLDCVYRGNLYKKGKCVGDYECDDSVELSRAFSKEE